MIRSFIAIELGPELREWIAAVQQAIRDELGRELRHRGPGARIQWVRPESMHVTLKFLGDVAEESLGDLEAAMTVAARGRSPFRVEVGGLGAFPDPRAPRVLWLGLSGRVDALTVLAEELDRALQHLGFSTESKPFQPHLTFGRVKERSREVGLALARTGLMKPPTRAGHLDVIALSLMKSDLKSGGAVYTKLAETRLEGAGEE